MSEQPIIKVEHVSKTFRLPHDKSTSLKHSVINLYRRKRGYELQHALSDISFEVRKGEFYGIVGKNGGGKSTLLKVLSGIYTPTKGTVQVNGKLTPFIELGVGFNPELSGRENVFLNGALLGFNRSEMETMYKDIVEFAELERFMDQKLKNYSSGMQVRLAFSIAIRAQSDILVMDEVLAVGDAAFQKKCFDVFRKLKKQGKTIVLVTHDMGNVERFCDRVLVLDKGEQLGIMSPAEASTMYARLNIDKTELGKGSGLAQTRNRHGKGGVTLKNVEFLSNGKPTDIFNLEDSFTLRITLDRTKEHKTTPITCGLAFFNEDSLSIIGPNSDLQPIQPDAEEILFTLPKLPLAPGEYAITIALYDKESLSYYDFLDKWVRFSVIADHVTHGLVEIDGKWESK
jgi:ABC-2 type transport system ATP-binding protein